jgi:membrane-associated protein
MPHFDLEHLIRTVGYFGVGLAVFAETGLFVGILLPGDSLLFTAGFLASQGYFNIALLCLIVFCASFAGDNTGYFIGHKLGRRLFTRSESRFFKPEYPIRAQFFLNKHGGKAILLGKFMPIVRTMVPMVAGASGMQYRKFLTFNILGGLIWAVGVTLGGYFLGSTIPSVDKYLLPIIALVIIVSVAPTAIHIYREKGDEIKAELRRRMAKRKLDQSQEGGNHS